MWRWSAAALPRPGHPQSAGIDFVLARTRQHGAGRSWAQPAAAAAEAEHNIRPEAAPPSAEQVSSEQARAWHSGTHQGANCDPVTVRHTTKTIRLSYPTQLFSSVMFAICIVNHPDGHSDEQCAHILTCDK